MAGTTATATQVQAPDAALSRTRVAWLLTVTFLVALAIYYFIGIDEGMASLTGRSMVVHEWVHDSRHLLGFPCH